MNSIKHLLISQIFKSILIIFMSTIFLLNIAFYFFSNDQFQKEIGRQFDALYKMTAHLSKEENLQTLEVYLEHYSHTNDVIIHFKDDDGVSVFSNDDEHLLQRFEKVYYDDILVGYIAVNFESSSLSKDMLYGFIGLNLLSFTLFAFGVVMLFKFLKKENSKIKNDLLHIGVEDSIFTYREIMTIHEELISNRAQRDKQKNTYEAHIKSLAHDIKTPLSVLKIYADSLINDMLEPSKEILNEMKEEVGKISDLIPKFIEQDYNELPYVQDISIYISKFVKKYREIFDSKKISIETYLESLKLNISDKNLERLIEHLTMNAFYYSKHNSTIKIIVDEQTRTLVIEDNGIGMSKETIQMIMKSPFRAKEAMILNEKGSGIGYQIIHDIIKHTGARIHIESEIDHGTKVSVHFL
ncbi:MAG: hypothetical protein CVV57_09865 [Tenericutes bacterium HGW-Tenericutes-2]|nr:MAG: hypothetical protein CVV58_00855 [Tenericutes bacterium HGW-Tenericutes-3]PKK97949.1 MAG: hypothetical protein CVV57_09865 [Tenericutes bacterium HGW-Tenericutes-2]